jgi:DNA end-binding protein Ku
MPLGCDLRCGLVSDGPAVLQDGDTYTEALQQVIEAKREGQAPPQAPEPTAAPGKVMGLMAALNESVSRAKASRGESTEAEVHELPEKKSAAKKTTKKQPAKKAAAKKTSRRRPRSA